LVLFKVETLGGFGRRSVLVCLELLWRCFTNRYYFDGLAISHWRSPLG